MSNLVDHLFSAGRDAAQGAIDAWARGDACAFALQAGASVELLTKAALARVNPLLLADPRCHPEALIWLAQLSSLDGPVHPRLISVSAEVALERAKPLRTDLKSHDSILKQIRLARNSAAHFAAGSTTLLEKAAEVASALLVLAEPHVDGFFGIHEAVVGVLLRQFEDEADRECQRRVEVARARFFSRDEERGSAVMDAIQAIVLARTAEPDGYPIELRTVCPACGRVAGIVGEIDAQWDSDDGETGYVTSTFRSANFTCDTCGLALASADMVRRSGVLDHVEIPEDAASAVADARAEYERELAWDDFLANASPSDLEGCDEDGH